MCFVIISHLFLIMWQFLSSSIKSLPQTLIFIVDQLNVATRQVLFKFQSKKTFSFVFLCLLKAIYFSLPRLLFFSYILSSFLNSFISPGYGFDRETWSSKFSRLPQEIWKYYLWAPSNLSATSCESPFITIQFVRLKKRIVTLLLGKGCITFRRFVLTWKWEISFHIYWKGVKFSM